MWSSKEIKQRWVVVAFAFPFLNKKNIYKETTKSAVLTKSPK